MCIIHWCRLNCSRHVSPFPKACHDSDEDMACTDVEHDKHDDDDEDDDDDDDDDGDDISAAEATCKLDVSHSLGTVMPSI